jgi:hypothetical protein
MIETSEPAADHPPRSRRRGFAIARALVVLALIIAGLAWLRFRTTAGPLAAPAWAGSTTSTIPIAVGERVSVGVEAPTYRGSGTVVVNALVPDQVPSALQVLGYRAITWGEGGVGAMPSYPPAGFDLHPVAGFVVRPGQALALVVGLRPLQAGCFEIPGFTLRYHVGGRSYAAHYRQADKVCGH